LNTTVSFSHQDRVFDKYELNIEPKNVLLSNDNLDSFYVKTNY
jgi:hypothetical protein